MMLKEYILNYSPNTAQNQSWLADLQREAHAQLIQNGVPNRKNENWRYTSLRHFESLDTTTLKSENISPWPVVLDEHHIHLTLTNNGSILSETFPQEQIVCHSADEMPRIDWLRQQDISLGGFTNQINTLFLNEVRIFDVEKSTKLNVFNTSTSQPLISHLLVFRVRKGVELNVNFESSSQVQSLKNVRMIFVVEEKAQASLTKILADTQDSLTFSRVDASLAEEARFDIFEYSEGQKLGRNEVVVQLQGEGAQANASGLYLGHGQNHIDHNVEVYHAVAHCQSAQDYRGILNEQSRAVFNARIRVAREAQKTEAKQLNKTLLLSDEAEMDTKPQLEIDADDVKCGHGAAIAQINPDELFYLQSRGFSPEEGEKVLTMAFAEGALGQIADVSIRKKLGERIHKRGFHGTV